MLSVAPAIRQDHLTRKRLGFPLAGEDSDPRYQRHEDHLGL